MASGQSTTAVLASIAGTAAIASTKFVAAAFSGSAAMLAEGIHSLVDTGDSLLLYLGLRRSTRPPDRSHPFGYGMDLYFWTVIVALIMFAIGGCVTGVQGVRRVLQPEPLEHLGWNYAVLGIAAVFNAFTWAVALKQFLAGKGNESLWRGLQRVKDPSVLTILLEDSASLVGLAVAFLGLFLGDLFRAPALDGAASVIIGLLMGAVAVGLVYQSKTLLVGESANKEVVDDIRAQVEADPATEQVVDLLTMHFGPREILVNLKVRFRDGLGTRELGGRWTGWSARSENGTRKSRECSSSPAP
jgi:cation diffusion facilitator family transporter